MTSPRGKNKPGRPKGSPSKSASFRLPEQLLERLASAAEDQERSQTTLVKRALEAYLAKRQEEAKEKEKED